MNSEARTFLHGHRPEVGNGLHVSVSGKTILNQVDHVDAGGSDLFAAVDSACLQSRANREHDLTLRKSF